MPSLSIKDVPEPLLEAIRRRAARNHRSLQGELMALLEAAATLAGTEIDTAAARPASTAGAPRCFAEAAAEFRRRFPSTSGSKSESSTDFIREMRDTHYGEAWVMAGIKDGHWPSQPGDSKPIPGIGLLAKQQTKTGRGKKK